MEPTQPVPQAKWDRARDVWVTIPEADTLPGFERSDVYSATFATSGMTRSGTAYALPTWAHRTDGSECSSSPGLLPTPRASSSGGSSTETVALLPTPGASAGEKGRATGQDPAPRREKGKQVELADIICWELTRRD